MLGLKLNHVSKRGHWWAVICLPCIIFYYIVAFQIGHIMDRVMTFGPGVRVTNVWWLPPTDGVGGAVRFLVVGTIGQEERPPRGQLWMEQCLALLKYWPIWYTIWADPNYTWGLAILADSLIFSGNNILAGLWLNCISSVQITLFLLADILLQHRALFQC